MRLCQRLAGAVVLAAVSACEPTGPADRDGRRQDFLTLPPVSLPVESAAGQPEEELTFARLAPGVEAEVQDTSFWAVRGQAHTLEVRYLGQGPDDAPLLVFEVGEQSLLTYPDGVPFQPGDSVQIRVTLDPARRFIFHFQPSGLTFSPFEPARLRLNYDGADDDVNGDGLVDIADQVLEQQWRIWRQELPGLPWLQLPTLRVPFADIVEGLITHFTGFAMAT